MRVTSLMRRASAVVVGLAALSAVQSQEYQGRRAWTMQNDRVKLVITPGGGHIASMTLKSGPAANLNPFWLPPWKSVEPGVWRTNPAAYGDRPAAQLLSTILGHNICLDYFGAPSAAETLAGLPVHGEAPTINWQLSGQTSDRITYTAVLPVANMRITRTVRLTPGSSAAWITETVENLRPRDRAFGWQQHATFGPPFLEAGVTWFDMPGGQSMVYPKEFSTGERLKRGAEFTWPEAPASSGGTVDLRRFPTGGKSSDFTATLLDSSRKWGYVTVVNSRRGLLAGYVWPRADWPWVGNWEEQNFRSGRPWNGKAVARGMEFGTTPFPDSLKDAVSLGSLFKTPTYRWISANAKQTIGYGLFIAAVPAGTSGVSDVQVEGASIKVTLADSGRFLTLPFRR